MVMVMEFVFFFGKVRWLFPFHISKGLHRIFDRLLRKHQVLVCKSWLQKKKVETTKKSKNYFGCKFQVIYWLYSNPYPFLWWAVAGFFSYVPGNDGVAISTAVAAAFTRLATRSGPHFRGVTGPFSSCSLEDLDNGFTEWDMLWLQAHCWKSGGSSLKWGKPQDPQNDRFWRNPKSILADLKKAAPI